MRDYTLIIREHDGSIVRTTIRASNDWDAIDYALTAWSNARRITARRA